MHSSLLCLLQLFLSLSRNVYLFQAKGQLRRKKRRQHSIRIMWYFDQQHHMYLEEKINPRRIKKGKRKSYTEQHYTEIGIQVPSLPLFPVVPSLSPVVSSISCSPSIAFPARMNKTSLSTPGRGKPANLHPKERGKERAAAKLLQNRII